METGFSFKLKDEPKEDHVIVGDMILAHLKKVGAPVFRCDLCDAILPKSPKNNKLRNVFKTALGVLECGGKVLIYGNNRNGLGLPARVMLPEHEPKNEGKG